MCARKIAHAVAQGLCRAALAGAAAAPSPMVAVAATAAPPSRRRRRRVRVRGAGRGVMVVVMVFLCCVGPSGPVGHRVGRDTAVTCRGTIAAHARRVVHAAATARYGPRRGGAVRRQLRRRRGRRRAQRAGLRRLPRRGRALGARARARRRRSAAPSARSGSSPATAPSCRRTRTWSACCPQLIVDELGLDVTLRRRQHLVVHADGRRRASWSTPAIRPPPRPRSAPTPTPWDELYAPHGGASPSGCSRRSPSRCSAATRFRRLVGDDDAWADLFERPIGELARAAVRRRHGARHRAHRRPDRHVHRAPTTCSPTAASCTT